MENRISDQTVERLGTMMHHSSKDNDVYILGCTLWVALNPNLEDYQRLLDFFNRSDMWCGVEPARLKTTIEYRATHGKIGYVK